MKLIFGSRALQALCIWLTTIAFEEVCLSVNCCSDLLDLFISDSSIKTNLLNIGNDRNMSLDALELLLTSSKSPDKILVISVWTYGTAPDITRLRALKIKYGFILLEDRCLSRPITLSEIDELPIAADAYLFSTGYSKYCDLLYGGWLIENTSSNSVINQVDINIEKYFESILSRRAVVDQHKKYINSMLKEHIKSIAMNGWIADTWRLTFEVERADLLKDLVWAQGIFCSNHYSRAYVGCSTFPELITHQRHVINFFNDLRVGGDYCSSIIKAIHQYKNALRHSREVR